MKKTIWIPALAAFVIFCGSAHAETIRGTVVSKSPSGQAFTVRQIHPNVGRAEKVKVYLKDGTQLFGVASLEELQYGDEVFIDVSRSAGDWKADAVRLRQSVRDEGEAQPQPGEAVYSAPPAIPENSSGSPSEQMTPVPDTSAPGTRHEFSAEQHHAPKPQTTQNEREDAARAAAADPESV